MAESTEGFSPRSNAPAVSRRAASSLESPASGSESTPAAVTSRCCASACWFLPAPDQLKREDQADIQEGWITQEMRESFADTAYEVDSSEMEWTEIEVTDG